MGKYWWRVKGTLEIIEKPTGWKHFSEEPLPLLNERIYLQNTPPIRD